MMLSEDTFSKAIEPSDFKVRSHWLVRWMFRRFESDSFLHVNVWSHFEDYMVIVVPCSCVEMNSCRIVLPNCPTS